MFNSELEEKVSIVGSDVNQALGRISALETATRLLDVRYQLVYRRLSNVVVNQNETRAAVNSLVGIINENAAAGNGLASAFEDRMRTIGAMFQRTQEAIEAVASEIGKKIEIVPEVPATVTFTPAEPARVALVKATKVRRVKPQPVTVEVPQNLLAPGGFVSDFD